MLTAGAVTRADPALNLLRASDDGAEVAFDALFRAHRAGMCSLAFQIVRSRSVAEELVQDVFVRIWERSAPPSARRRPRSRRCIPARRRHTAFPARSCRFHRARSTSTAS
jgi:DNA-directed RNA polymerase specialized sigma24 family protein